MTSLSASTLPAFAAPVLAAHAIGVAGVEHRYGERVALAGLSLNIAPGELFAILGPNGGGKSTLFRLLSTLIPLQRGEVNILGYDLRRDPQRIRERIGVVFQSPSLDKKLTVRENLWYQGRLHGLSSRNLAARRDELLERFGLASRARERVEALSGGLRRRVELAKGLLHRPSLLLLDEPTAGLDPVARKQLWEHLDEVRASSGMTVAFTTHLLDEADRVDRLAILHLGKLVALDSPAALRSLVGGDTITIQTDSPDALAEAIARRFDCPVAIVAGHVRLAHAKGHRLVAELVEAFADRISAITLGKPTLEDVFIARTGHRFEQPESDVIPGLPAPHKKSPQVMAAAATELEERRG